MGANLECFLIYRNSVLNSISLVKEFLIRVIHSHKIEMSVVEDEKYFMPKVIESIDEINLNNTTNITLTGSFNFYDTLEKCTVCFYVKVNTIKISISEKVIWGNNIKSKPKIERLEAYFDICKEITRIQKPEYMVIGTESHYPENMTYSKVVKSRDFKKFKPSDFDKENLVNLFKWYTTNYYHSED